MKKAEFLLGRKVDQPDLVVVGRTGKERIIPSSKYYINRNTPVGEDAEFIERMPHNGQRWIDTEKIIAEITNGVRTPFKL